MAVYKPTNCQPYLTTFDLMDCINESTPTLFECKVDTSNTKVTAYAITLYNSENTQIFPVDDNENPVDPQDNISFISDLSAITASYGQVISSVGYVNLNTGINGSYLHIPVFANQVFSGTVSYNSLVVNGEGEVTAQSRQQTDGRKPVTIENGQQYKWVITLFQGVKKGDNSEVLFPESIYEYDMIVTTGQIMGSNIERIQSYLSDQIYVDYYVQPVQINGLKIVDETKGSWTCDSVTIPEGAPRVRIKNYDSSYGYIYPQTGDSGFTENQINPEGYNGFQVYAMGNNPEDLTETRKVAIANAQDAIPWIWNEYLTDIGQSYGTQVYYINQSSAEFTQASNNRIFFPFDVVRTNNKTITDLEQIATAEGGQTTNWANCFMGGGRINQGLGISSDMRIVLNAQYADNSEYGKEPSAEEFGKKISGNTQNGSPFNGIYTPSITFQETVRNANNEVVEGISKVIITWNRTTDANTWGSLMNSIVYINGTGIGKVYTEDNTEGFQFQRGINIQTRRWDNTDNKPLDSSTAYGSINSSDSPVKFYTELPEEIYTFTGDDLAANTNINTVGLILYNTTSETQEEDKLATLYIRPFVGLEPMMWLRELTTSESETRFFLVQSVNEKTWAVKYNPDEVWLGNEVGKKIAENKYFDINQRYQIRTFYKSSDENPFNLYSNPNITLMFYPSDWQGEGDTENEPYNKDGTQTGVVTIGSRSFTVSCDYTQDQYVWWKSFNYVLYDTVGNELSTSGDKYDGLMQHTFYGLINENSYVLVLTVETYSGNVISIQRELYCDFEATDLTNTFPFDVYFDCDINAVRAEFRVTGYILPNVVDENGNQVSRVVAETSNNTSPAISGVTYNSSGSMNIGEVDEEGVTYTHAVGSLAMVGGLSQLTAESDSILVQSSHTVNSSRFAGNFICAYVGFDSSEAKLPDDYKLVVYIPDELVVDEEGYTTENPDRNKVMYDLLDSNGASVISGPLVANLYNQMGNQISDNKWRDDLYVLPEWQSAIRPDGISQINFGDSNHVVYKPVDDILTDADGNQHIANANNVNGYFNTTSKTMVYNKGVGTTANVEWFIKEGAPRTQVSPLVSLNDEMFNQGAQSDGAAPKDGRVYTGFEAQPGEGETENEIFCVVATLGSDVENPQTPHNDFVIVNKMPVVWGDYMFDSGDALINISWKIATIYGIGPTNAVIDGMYTKTYYEDTESPFIWNDMEDSEEQGTATGATVRWFDGWGYNNGAGLEDSKVYDADLSPIIYVGNQTRVTDASLTNSERASISGKTFAIQAKIGVNDEGQTYIEPDVRVYLSGVNN